MVAIFGGCSGQSHDSESDTCQVRPVSSHKRTSAPPGVACTEGRCPPMVHGPGRCIAPLAGLLHASCPPGRSPAWGPAGPHAVQALILCSLWAPSGVAPPIWTLGVGWGPSSSWHQLASVGPRPSHPPIVCRPVHRPVRFCGPRDALRPAVQRCALVFHPHHHPCYPRPPQYPASKHPMSPDCRGLPGTAGVSGTKFPKGT